jgi:hypothetical protein
MPKEKDSDAPKSAATKADGVKAAESAAKELQETFDKANEQGFFGDEVDSTPNENYTVQGVTSGAPTPETDAELASAVREHTKMGKSALELNAQKEGK